MQPTGWLARANVGSTLRSTYYIVKRDGTTASKMHTSIATPDVAVLRMLAIVRPLADRGSTSTLKRVLEAVTTRVRERGSGECRRKFARALQHNAKHACAEARQASGLDAAVVLNTASTTLLGWQAG